jgi:hypothetical protein
MFPQPPTNTGNTASYVVIVRQNGAVVEGQYTLGGISPSTYSSVTCIYYDTNNAEITRSVSGAKPGSCTVSDAGIPGVNKLEMRVIGIDSPPTGGYITVDGSYKPTRSMSNYGNNFGGSNSEICTTMNVNPSNMPSEQIRTDSNTGAVTWNVVPKRFNPNSLVRLQQVVVQGSNTNMGTITITPYARQNSPQIAALDSISGQANSPITGFPSDYSVDIYFFLVTMSPADSSSAIDPNQVMVTVNYCTVTVNPNTPPTFNGNQPYYMPNSVANSYNPVNPQTRKFSPMLRLIVFLHYIGAIYYGLPQQPYVQRNLLGPGNDKTVA